MSVKMPPLRPFDTYECDGYTEKDYCDDGLYVTVEEVEARERILLARVERLELTVQELGLRNADLEAHIKSLEAINENNLAEAAARIVDLEAVLSETVALYGKPGGPWNIPGDPGGWLERARAAISGSGVK